MTIFSCLNHWDNNFDKVEEIEGREGNWLLSVAKIKLEEDEIATTSET